MGKNTAGIIGIAGILISNIYPAQSYSQHLFGRLDLSRRSGQRRLQQVSVGSPDPEFNFPTVLPNCTEELVKNYYDALIEHCSDTILLPNCDGTCASLDRYYQCGEAAASYTIALIKADCIVDDELPEEIYLQTENQVVASSICDIRDLECESCSEFEVLGRTYYYGEMRKLALKEGIIEDPGCLAKVADYFSSISESGCSDLALSAFQGVLQFEQEAKPCDELPSDEDILTQCGAAAADGFFNLLTTAKECYPYKNYYLKEIVFAATDLTDGFNLPVDYDPYKLAASLSSDLITVQIAKLTQESINCIDLLDIYFISFLDQLAQLSAFSRRVSEIPSFRDCLSQYYALEQVAMGAPCSPLNEFIEAKTNENFNCADQDLASVTSCVQEGELH